MTVAQARPSGAHRVSQTLAGTFGKAEVIDWQVLWQSAAGVAEVVAADVEMSRVKYGNTRAGCMLCKRILASNVIAVTMCDLVVELVSIQAGMQAGLRKIHSCRY